MRRVRASILVGLLWCLALLSLIVIGLLHTARRHLQVGKNYSDRLTAHYLAVAGIETAKALVYQDAQQRSRSGQNHGGQLFNAPDQFRQVAFGRGQFSVFRRGRLDEGGALIYGVSDEEGRLNANNASAEELAKLYGITPDTVASIIDWRDEDNVVTPGGAEAEYYLALQPPCLPRNGPLQTVRELLMVRSVSRQLLLGRDVHDNGLLDQAELDTVEPLSDVWDTGWASLLTVDSSVRNVNAAGQPRVSLQTADEAALSSVRGITTEIARAIVAFRGQRRFESVADLLEVTAAPSPEQAAAQALSTPGQTNARPPVVRGNAPAPAATTPNPAGPKVVSADLLMEIADDLTAQGERELPGLVNVNTAGLEVLACLPGMDRELAQAVISFRQSNGYLPNIAWLLKVPGMNTDRFKQIAPRVSARSETYRILSEGKVNSSGVRQRIQEIVHIGLNDLTTVSYREKDL